MALPISAYVLRLAFCLYCFRCTEPVRISHLGTVDRAPSLAAPAVNSTRQKWAERAHLKASEGSFIDSRDMGVTHCKLFLDGEAFGTALRYNGLIGLDIFLRYTHHAGMAHLKGSVSMAPIGPVEAQEEDVQLDPRLMLFTADNVTSFALRGRVTFPFVSAGEPGKCHVHGVVWACIGSGVSPRMKRHHPEGSVGPGSAPAGCPEGDAHLPQPGSLAP